MGALKTLQEDLLNMLLNRNWNIKGRRVINAGDSQDLQDYVTLAEIQKRNPTISYGTLSPNTKPTSPKTGDLFYATDFNHMYRFTGSTWSYADEGRGHVAWCIEAKGTGWRICDGTAGVTFSKSDGTTETKTVPNLNNNTFPRFAAAYSGPNPTAAVAPTISGNTGSSATGLTTNQASTGITIDAEAAHTHSVTTNVSLDAHTQVATTTALGAATRLTAPVSHAVQNPAVTSAAGSSHTHTLNGNTNPTHNHGVTDPTHNHGGSSLTVSTTGLPALMDGIPYIRL